MTDSKYEYINHMVSIEKLFSCKHQLCHSSDHVFRVMITKQISKKEYENTEIKQQSKWRKIKG